VSARRADPFDAPDGETYIVRVYRSGSMARFPSTGNTPAPGGLLLAPLILLGWLLHLAVFHRRWTVAVGRWHNLPGRRYRELAETKVAAEARAATLQHALQSGGWTVGSPPPRLL
jgi:hypothetical protein